MVEYIQIITTTEKKEDAEQIASALVERRLAACVQIVGPIVSTYWWKETVTKTGEWLCLIKSKKNLYEELEEFLQEIHPYEIPEIMALPIIAGSEAYMKWLDNELK